VNRNPPWRSELDLAMDAAWSAGRVTLRWFQTGVAAERKSDRSPVTIADREAERVMRDLLRERFPDDGILGEEQGEEPGTSGRRWILDPIDGTRSFVHGVPLYGVMVALESDGEPVLGVLHFPALGETVAAARGLGCRWNGRPCRVSETERLEDALVLTSGDARPDDPRSTGLARLAQRADTFRTWGDCYGYALVATGRADAMLDPVLALWDAAAVRPVIEEAGGVFTDWDGAKSHRAGHAIGTNARIAEAILQEVRP
jgi:histidinol phosphatase-like enzyme (inositol monophosphatase family)